MLVGAGLEPHVAALRALEAGDRVGGDRLISMADVWPAVGVADRGRDVERLGHSLCPNRHRSALQGTVRVATEARIPPSWNTVEAGSSDSRGPNDATSRDRA